MFLDALFWLIVLHFIADYQLQTDFIAANKVPGRYQGWYFVMTAHAAVHGAAVAYVLSPLFGLAEFVSHWLIDTAKSKGFMGGNSLTALWIDQILHISLKLLWLGLFIGLQS